MFLLFFSSFYYSTYNTQYTILLQPAAGFVGLQTFHFAYAGLCLMLNTAGPELLAVLLLFVAGQTFDAAATTAANAAAANATTATTAAVPSATNTRLCLWIGVTHRIALIFSAAAAAAMHRRHLFVWAIFAPKLAFEAFLFCTIGGTLLLALLASYSRRGKVII
jgi:hypothetical protein